jgi:hypothetical protein
MDDRAADTVRLAAGSRSYWILALCGTPSPRASGFDEAFGGKRGGFQVVHHSDPFGLCVRHCYGRQRWTRHVSRPHPSSLRRKTYLLRFGRTLAMATERLDLIKQRTSLEVKRE